MSYIGRFAPSPTGPLHFGSLLAALVSYLDARAQGGRWLVRMEDIDPPREMPGAATLILRQLEEHGLHWDGDVRYQSQRHPHYQHILDQLFARGIAYYCDCSRQLVQAMGGIYNGRCFRRQGVDCAHSAVRLHLPDDCSLAFSDIFQGEQRQLLSREVGDFIVRRRDGLFAYQLAVVVDDIGQGITHVLRGMDLLDSTARQIWLMQTLGAPAPEYGHIPVALNVHGQKLSKQNHAPSLDCLPPLENLRLALHWLGMVEVAGESVTELLAGAVRCWRRSLLVGKQGLLAPSGYC